MIESVVWRSIAKDGHVWDKRCCRDLVKLFLTSGVPCHFPCSVVVSGGYSSWPCHKMQVDCWDAFDSLKANALPQRDHTFQLCLTTSCEAYICARRAASLTSFSHITFFKNESYIVSLCFKIDLSEDVCCVFTITSTHVRVFTCEYQITFQKTHIVSCFLSRRTTKHFTRTLRLKRNKNHTLSLK